MAVATYADVAVALGRPISTPAEQAQVEWWLDGVEIIIEARLGDLSEIDEDVLRYVEVQAVVAKIQRHGTTESSITVAVDDGSVTRRYENAMSAADITNDWWNLLRPGTDSAAFSTRPSFDPDDVPVDSWA